MPSPPLFSSQQDLPMTSLDKHFQRLPSAYRIKAPLRQCVQGASQSDLSQLPPSTSLLPTRFPAAPVSPTPAMCRPPLPGFPRNALWAFTPPAWPALSATATFLFLEGSSSFFQTLFEISMKPRISPGRILLPSSVFPEHFLMWPPQPAHV